MLVPLSGLHVFLHDLSIKIGQDCPVPAPIANGEIQGTVHAVGSKITYICNSGYELNGSKTRTCGTNRQWSPAAPTCTSKRYYC